MKDLFEKRLKNLGPLGSHSKEAHGYYTFPKLEGELGNRMIFRGKERIVWSLNNYLGLANHPEVRETDTQATQNWGMAYPMGARMMSGQTDYHELLEKQLAEFTQKEDAYLLNFGYQGILSVIDAMVDRHDVIVYDSESHACIIDGVRLHAGKRFVFAHNDIQSLEKQLQHAQGVVEKTGGGILVISEGVFGMAGDQGLLKEIISFKKQYNFRLLVDDAHGFGTMGNTGAGTGEEQGIQNEIDLYFSTFAKSMASIGAFIAGDANIINYLRYNMRSQIFAKSLPMPIVIGLIKRLELLRNKPELKQKLWNNVQKLQDGLKQRGFNIGKTNSPVTPVYLNGTIPEATNLTLDLRERFNIFCSIVVYPVVPKGDILLRLIPTAVHTDEDIEYTLNAFSDIEKKLKNGSYQSEKIVTSYV